VGKTISSNFKKDYTINKIYSVNTFIEFAGSKIRENVTILNTVYNVLVSVGTREENGGNKND
jgi:hypothetical protein